MDAQQVEVKLTREAKEAWEAYLAEKDPARSDKLEKRWNKAEERLDSFRRQQVAGGEHLNKGCKISLHGMRQQVVKVGLGVARSSDLLVCRLQLVCWLT